MVHNALQSGADGLRQANWAPVGSHLGCDPQILLIVGHGAAFRAVDGKCRTAVLKDLIQRLHSPKKIVLLDACAAGFDQCSSAAMMLKGSGDPPCNALVLVAADGNHAESSGARCSLGLAGERTVNALTAPEQMKRRLRNWLSHRPLRDAVAEEYMREVRRLLEQAQWTSNNWLQLERYLFHVREADWNSALHRNTLHFDETEVSDGTAASKISWDLPICPKSAESDHGIDQFSDARGKQMSVRLWQDASRELTPIFD
jgi:hypothetical protein